MKIRLAKKIVRCKTPYWKIRAHPTKSVAEPNQNTNDI